MPEEYKPRHVSAQADERPCVVPVSANDNLDAYLDREIGSWTVDDLPDAPVLTNLDGTPCEPDPASAPLARIPQNGTARARVSFARDRRNLHVLKDFEPDARSSRTKWPKAPLVADTPSPSETPSKTTRKRKQADENDTRKAPTWSRTTEIIKGHAYVRTVSTRGAGLSWTLNLGGKVAQAANDNPEGLKEKLHDRLSKALKASPLGARDFVFSVERTKDGRWHMHGISDAYEREKDALDAVLRKAGGAWGSKHHEDKQTDVRIAWGPDGWCRYILKDSAATRRLLGTKTVLSVTRRCRQRAEKMWEASRRDYQEIHQDLAPELDQEIHQEARQRPTAPETPVTAPAPSEPACESVEPAPALRPSTAKVCTVSMPLTPAGQFRLLATARSRGPPGSASGPSAGPDPPLAKCRLVGQVSEHELAALAVAQRDDGRAGHEPGLPRHDGLAAHTGAARDRDDDRRVRVSHRPGADAADGAREGDPELPDAVAVARRLPGRSGTVGELPRDRDGEDGRRLRTRRAGHEGG